MEECNEAAWEELIDRVEQSGTDANGVNLLGHHGVPERKMGAAIGQDCGLLEEVCGWINVKATDPMKMTSNITHIVAIQSPKPSPPPFLTAVRRNTNEKFND